MGMQRLVGLREEFAFVLRPVLDEPVDTQFNHVLDQHPGKIISPNDPNKRPSKLRDQPTVSRHEYRKHLRGNNGAQ